MIPAQPGSTLRSQLLAASSATLAGLPADAVVERAFLFWSGSLAQDGVSGPKVADPAVTLSFGGSSFPVSAGAGCSTVLHPRLGTTFPPFFYCRAEITAELASAAPPGGYNGTYTVGGVAADAAHVDAAGNCAESPFAGCQAKYAAWSMVLIYRAASDPALRDVQLHDGFLLIDHEDGPGGSTGQATFSMGNFLSAENPQARLTFFAVEGDQQLGEPPQNLYAPSDPRYCTTCEDYLRFNGRPLADERRWPGNLFNESGGSGTGFDVDSINVSTLLPAGSTTATISVGSGTGPVIVPAPSHGGGELFGFGWTLLSVRRPAPSFDNPATFKQVSAATAGPGDTLSYAVTVSNTGTAPATSTVLTDVLPAELSYVPGSLRVGGAPCTDAADGDPCTVAGSTLSIALGIVDHVPPNNSRQITFSAVVAPTAADGAQVCNHADVMAAELAQPHSTPEACFTVVAPQLAVPTKVDQDLDGGLAEPEDIIQFTVTLARQGSAPVSGVSFVDDLPPHLQLLSVIPPPGAIDASSLTGGANGTGQVNLQQITVPTTLPSVSVVFLAQVDSVAEFAAQGIGEDQINGWSLCNQGQVTAPFLPSALATDDPAAAGQGDPTCFALTYSPLLGGSTKSGIDVDGGRLEPGDVLRYAITLANSGNRAATLTITDDLPAGVSGFNLLTPLPGAVFLPPPAGAQGTGQLTVSSLVVPPQTTQVVQFEVQVSLSAPHDLPIQNCAAFTVAENPAEGRSVCSSTLNVFAAPSLDRSVKTVVDDNGGAVVPGDALTYTISVENNGNRPATSASIVDVVPAELEGIVPADGGAYDPAARTITWIVGDVAVGAVLSRSFAATVVSPLPNGTLVCNQGRVLCAELAPVPTDDPSTAAADDATCVSVISAPDFSATTKIVEDLDGAPARPGDLLRYTITVRNDGTELATGVTVRDTLPAELVAVTPLDGGTYDPTTRRITWAAGPLAPAQAQTVRFTAQIASPLDPGTSIDNQAFVSADQQPPPGIPSDDPATPAIDDPTRIVVTSAADLSTSEKSFVDDNGGVPQPGDSLTFAITLRNTGDAIARSTTLADVVAVELTQITPLDGGVYDAASRTISWPAVDVAPAAPVVLRFRATLAVPLPDGTIVCNQAAASGPTLPAPVLTDDPSTPPAGDPTCLTVESRPELDSSTKTVVDLNGGAVEPGDVLRYTITVDNVGTLDATAVVVTDIVDANLTSIAPEEGGTLDAATRTITWAIPTVAARSKAEVHFNATVVLPLDDGTSIANQATITASALSPVLTDDPATPATDDPTVVTVTAAPDLSTSSKVFVDDNGGEVEPEDLLSYAITLINTGKSNADQLIVSDIIDANLEILAVGDGGTYDAASRTITWNSTTTPSLAQLAPGAGAPLTLTFSAKVASPLDHGTEICNQARITSEELSTPQPTDNPATPAPGDPTCATVSSAPDLSNTTKSVTDDNGGEVRPGDTLTYALQLTNTGTGAATEVTVTDVVDSRLTNVQPAEGGLFDAATRTITWSSSTTPPLANIAVGGPPVTLTFKATLVKPLDDGTVISNQATVSSALLPAPVLTDDPTTAALDDPTRVTVSAAPELDTSAKTVRDVNGGDPRPGDLLTWTISVKNTGDALARQVTVTDVVDQNLRQVTVLDGGSYDSATRTITWTRPRVELSPAGDLTLRFTARIVSPLPNGTAIANQARIVTPDLPAPVLTDDPATAAADDPTVVTVVSQPDLRDMTKSVSGALPGRRAAPRTRLTYTITVTNTGTADAEQLRVTDQLDEHLEKVIVLDGGSYTSSTRTVSWAAARLRVGEQKTMRFSAEVTTAVRDGTIIANQAFATHAGESTRTPSDDPETSVLDDPTRVTIRAGADLSQFDKEVRDENGGEANPGDALTYTLSVRNSGTSTAFDVEIVDQLPVQLELISVGDGGRYDRSTRTIVWNGNTTPALARLGLETLLSLSFRARIIAPQPDGQMISNQAFARAHHLGPEPSDDPSTPNANDPTTIRVVSKPNLADSTKRVVDLNGGLVQPGDQLEYVIRIVNSGSGDATGTLLVDAIPAYTDYVPGSTRLAGRAMRDPGGGAPLAQGLPVNSAGAASGALPVGEEHAVEARFRVRVRPDVQEGTIISNQGLLRCDQVALASTDDPDTPQKGDPTQVVVGSGPNLNNTFKGYRAKPLGDDGNGRFDVGEGIRYEVTIPNTGTAPATNVVFSDSLDPNGRARYVSHTLTLNGQQLTDEADGDAGTATGRKIRVVIGRLEPGAQAVIRYEATITAGPQVVNQGTVRATELQPELTDADGDDLNGDAPTVVAVGTGARHIRGEKAVQDLSGGEVRAGDELLYAITLFNDGDREERVDVVDHLPEQASFVAGSALTPPGARLTFEPPPAGAQRRGRLSVSNIALGAGESIRLVFRARLDADVDSGAAVCNEAILSASAGIDLLTTEPACVLVGSPLGTGALRGVVFRDIGEDDRILDERDQRLGGFTVQAFYFGSPNSTPVAGVISDGQGRYAFSALPPGPYTLRVLTANGAQIGTLSAVETRAGRSDERDLPVDPSGIVYDAVSGEPVPSARATLFYDAEDPSAPGQLVPERLLGTGQQGQLTDGTGFYKFDVSPGRRYRVQITPLSSTLQFPSTLIPPTAGFARTGPDNEVVPDDYPDPRREDARLTYYLRFAVDSEADAVFNNHIPVDPLRALIRLEKRADRARATVGDIVTYTIAVENRSSRDFIAPQHRVGIADLLPRGLRLLRGTAHRMRRARAASACDPSESVRTAVDGATVCFARAEPTTTGGRVLRFGPFPLGAGESVMVSYQVAIGLDTRLGVYTNTAVLKDEGFASELSNRDQALVTVEADPDLDQGLLFGKVFCDGNGDGRQDRGERGVPGARIYLDDGTYAISDSAGKYHLQDIDPGVRLLKIDENSLRPGTALTTDASRVIHFTRGLPAKVDFGVRCKEHWVKAQRVILAPKPKRKAAVKPTVVAALSLAGDARALALSADARKVPLTRAALSVRAAAGPRPKQADWDKRPPARLAAPPNRSAPLLFELEGHSPIGVQGWHLTVWRLAADGTRDVVRRFSGSGRPPAQLLWDGRLGGVQQLARGGKYAAQLELIAVAGGARSTVRFFAIGAAPHEVPEEPPAASLDGRAMVLDEQGRFATTVGRTSQQPLLVQLERGDGKSSWTALGAPRTPEVEPPERLLVEGNLLGPALFVNGKPVDLSLLRVGLASPAPDGQLPALDRRGELKTPVTLKAQFSTALVQRWRLRITDAKGQTVRLIEGLAPVPDPLRWDGRDDHGRPAVQPGATYFARLLLDDGQGNIGQSPELTLTAAELPFAPLKLQGAVLFSRTGGALRGDARRRLLRQLARLRRRPASERYIIEAVVAPPMDWSSERSAALIRDAQLLLTTLVSSADIPPERCAVRVGALPLRSRDGPAGKSGPPTAARNESLVLSRAALPATARKAPPATVHIDGTALSVRKDGAFRSWAKVELGSALVIDLRDGSGHRALLFVPTQPKRRLPTSHRAIESVPATRTASAALEPPPPQGELLLRMRAGGSLTLRLAQAPHVAPPPPPASSPTSRPAPPTSAPASAPSPSTSQPSGPFGAAELHRAFGAQRAAMPKPKKPAVPAAQLEVDLPPRGLPLKSRHLAVRGRTLPENLVTVNGTTADVHPDGSFVALVTLPEGKSDLLIRAKDKQGNVGTIRWPVRVADRELFLMALAEGAIGQPGVELDEDTADSRVATDALLLRGRAVLYLKGRIKGKYLFKRYLITAHVDTAKQREFEEFFDQAVDPNRYYPIYGDSSERVRDVNSRGKFYVLVEADRSKLIVGNFNADLRGIDLLRYDRVLHGVKIDLDKDLIAGKWRAEARAFVSSDDARLMRDHNVLRATGGSIYYLRHGQVLEGSERVRVVVRERDTGMKLAEALQTRDLDYVIDYPGGRLLFKSPLASVADAGFAAVNPSFSLSTLAGHPVYVEVEYEHEADVGAGGGSHGVQTRSTLFDALTLGGSYVSETRNADLGGDYRLYGAELRYRYGKATALAAEFARSESFDTANFFSEDGGVSYLSMNETARISADERAADSNAYKIAGKLELSDFVHQLPLGVFAADAYLEHLDRGFFSGGSILDQGRTRYGARIAWGITSGDKLTLRHDGAVAMLPQLDVTGTNLDPLKMREIETELSRARYELTRRRFAFAAEFAHSYSRDPLLDQLDNHRGTLGLLASYRAARWLKLTLGQDAILYAAQGDPLFGVAAPLGLAVASTADPLDRLMTTFGVALQLTKTFEVQAAEHLRWSGDNATSIGVKTRLSETASTYVRQLFGTTDEHFSTTTVVGAEDRFGPKHGGRTYGEYQLQSGALGRHNRALLGIAQAFAPWRGIGLTGGFEHQQVFGGVLPDGTPTGDTQRDVVHLGAELTRYRAIKLSTRAELRYDQGSGVPGLAPVTPSNPQGIGAPNVDPRLGAGHYADRVVTPGSFLLPSPGERWQLVTRTGIAWAATRALTLLARLNYYRTFNTTESRVEAEAMEMGFGAALRPPTWDTFNLLLKYTRILEMRPISLTEDLARRRTYDVVSVVPILELPLRLQLVEKLAYKRVLQQLDLLEGESQSTATHTLLWINRLNLHITGQLDAGVEYRFLRLFLEGQGDQLKHGALVELGYWLHRMIRLGVGYNFSRFSDDEFADQDRDASGFFFRVVGRY